MRIAHPVRVLASVSVLVGGLVGGAPPVVAPVAAASDFSVVAVDKAHQLVHFTAGPGLRNDLVVRQDRVTLEDGTEATRFRFQDRAPHLIARTGCSWNGDPDAHDPWISCILRDSPDVHPFLRVRLGDEADQADVSIQLGTARIEGGAGNDTLLSRHGDQHLYGGTGADELRGGVGHGGAGADEISGGRRSYGDAGNDTLTGGARADVLYGGMGADVIRGNQGNDVLYGNSGDDVLYGNSGNDKLLGGPGKDTLSGGPGNDSLKQ